MRCRQFVSWAAGLALILSLGGVPVWAAEMEAPPAESSPEESLPAEGTPEDDNPGENGVDAGQGTPAVPVTGVSLSPGSLTLAVGSSSALTVQVHPFNASNQTVTWSSSDERVAAVDNGGMVTAVGPGRAVVTVTTRDGGFTASCTVLTEGAAEVYPPLVKKTSGGTTTVFPSRPTEGSTVTISAVPNVGHEVEKVSVTDQEGGAIPVVRHQDGTWAFRQPDSRVTVSVTFRRKPWTNPFSDVRQSDWFYDSVALVCQEGLMNGTGQGFEPETAVTRGTLATILARMDGKDTSGGKNWYDKGVAWAVAEGVSDGTNPEGTITREQTAVMLYRCAGSPAVSGGNELSRFPDGGRVSSWAQRAMRWAVAEDLLQGDGRGLNPQGQTTRAELAAILSRFLTID